MERQISEQSPYHLSMTIWVQIPRAHAKPGLIPGVYNPSALGGKIWDRGRVTPGRPQVSWIEVYNIKERPPQTRCRTRPCTCGWRQIPLMPTVTTGTHTHIHAVITGAEHHVGLISCYTHFSTCFVMLWNRNNCKRRKSLYNSFYLLHYRFWIRVSCKSPEMTRLWATT